MIQAYKKKIRNHIFILSMELISFQLLIITLVFGFLVVVYTFENQERPPIVTEFSQHYINLTNELTTTKAQIQSTLNNAKYAEDLKTKIIQSNLDTLTEKIKSTTGSINELSKSVYDNQKKITDSYLDGKRILFIFSGLFIAYLVKLFAGLFRYKTYLISHYRLILEALELSTLNEEENQKIDLNRFSSFLESISVKHIRIDQGGSILEGLLLNKKT